MVILGAGINGAALARELALAGVPVCIIDQRDLSCGATAFSSRLIHGGLRYLEYGEFDLVRESLIERTRLLRLAPHFVRPLRLYVPVERRRGGLGASLRRLLHLPDSRRSSRLPRGLWLVRMGLWTYDRYARDPMLAPHSVCRAGDRGTPQVDAARYRWMCAFSDAQIRWPERFVVSLLHDARETAASLGIPLRVYTGHRAALHGEVVEVLSASGRVVDEIPAAAVVNATGAWVDLTLSQLAVPSKRLIGGTKGSHFLTFNQPLREALCGQAIYAEAADGRPVFILPFGEATLVGTTDERFEGDPAAAIASEAELEYLIAGVHQVIPSARLTRHDVAQHYAGVRPLPYHPRSSTAAVTRRHWLHEHAGSTLPLYSVVGGKLTTCCRLAQQSAAVICRRLGIAPTASPGERPLPGSEDYPASDGQRAELQRRIAEEAGLDEQQVAAVWELWGMQSRAVLAPLGATDGRGADAVSLDGTHLPRAAARWAIRHEWARSLDDLVERRLMLLYHRRLTGRCLRELAELLREEGASTAAVEDQAAATAARLKRHFGKEVVDPPAAES